MRMQARALGQVFLFILRFRPAI